MSAYSSIFNNQLFTDELGCTCAAHDILWDNVSRSALTCALDAHLPNGTFEAASPAQGSQILCLHQ